MTHLLVFGLLDVMVSLILVLVSLAYRQQDCLLSFSCISHAIPSPVAVLFPGCNQRGLLALQSMINLVLFQVVL